MAPPLSTSAPSAPRARLTAWILTPRHHETLPRRLRAGVIIALLIALVGWVDFVTGPRLALSLFYLVPIILGLVWLDARAAGLAALGCVVVRVGGDMAAGGDPIGIAIIFWNRLVELSFYLVLIWALSAFLRLHRQLEVRVRERTAELEKAITARNELQNKLFEVSRRERSAIGHELHDGLGQHLTAISFAANHLAGKLALDKHPASADAHHLAQMTQEGIAQTRLIARGLLLAAVEPGELGPKLTELTAALQAKHGTVVRFAQSGEPTGQLDDARSSHLFYIAQEATLNALRHGQPSEVTVQLTATGEALELSIIDDGGGLPPAAKTKTGMGLRIMAHRAELLGGKFLIESTPGEGVSIQCRLPLLARPGPTGIQI